MKEKEIILDTDPNIVEYKTNIEGWVGKDGRFYGKEKELAIYANSTHRKCENGHIYSKHWIKCQVCENAKRPTKYMQMPFKEWDKETPLCLFMDDKYFFSVEDVEDYLDTEELKIEDLELVICEPNYLWEVQSDFWEDIMPEDTELEEIASKELLEKLNELNNIIKAHKPVSWNGGSFRTTVKT